MLIPDVMLAFYGRSRRMPRNPVGSWKCLGIPVGEIMVIRVSPTVARGHVHLAISQVSVPVLLEGAPKAPSMPPKHIATGRTHQVVRNRQANGLIAMGYFGPPGRWPSLGRFSVGFKSTPPFTTLFGVALRGTPDESGFFRPPTDQPSQVNQWVNGLLHRLVLERWPGAQIPHHRAVPGPPLNGPTICAVIQPP